MSRWLTIIAAAGLAVALVLAGLCFFGLWIPNEPSLAKYPIRGIDVSHHQRDIDWKVAKASGIHFTYIKATEGVDFKDPKFSENWTGSDAASLLHGAYHFFTLGQPGDMQASNFIATVPVGQNVLPPAIDLEFSGYNRVQRSLPKEFQRELSLFWDAIFAHYRKMPVVYTTSDFQKRYLTQMPVERLWVRQVIFTPREAWMFWQFSPRGRIPGVRGFVDLDVFAGSEGSIESVLRGR